MWESADELGWIVITVSGRSFNNLCYEDDIVLIATSVSGLQYPINKASVQHSDNNTNHLQRKSAATGQHIQISWLGDHIRVENAVLKLPLAWEPQELQ